MVIGGKRHKNSLHVIVVRCSLDRLTGSAKDRGLTGAHVHHWQFACDILNHQPLPSGACNKPAISA